MEFILQSPGSPVLFSFFGYEIRYYGLILTCAIFIGFLLSYNMFKIYVSKDDAEFFVNYSPFLILISIIGARLFYVFGDFGFYLYNKKEILLINHGGLSIWGALIFGIACLYFFLTKNKKNCLLHLDIISVSVPLCQAIGRFGNFFNQEAFGKPADLFIKLYIDKNHRPNGYENFDYFHPAFLYEAILDCIIFIVLMFILLKFNNLKKGTIFCLYIILYSIARLIVETIRIDSVAFVFKIPVASFICIIMIILSMCFLIKIYKK